MSDDKMTHFEMEALVKKLSRQVETQEQRQLALEQENKLYKDEMTKMGKETAFQRFNKKKAYVPIAKEKPILVKEPVLNQRGDNYYPTKDGCCPYCLSVGDDSFLDQMDSGRWACRMCGKMWFEEQLNQPYSKEMDKASGNLTAGKYSDVESR